MYKQSVVFIIIAFVAISRAKDLLTSGWNNCGPPDSILGIWISDCSHTLHEEDCEFGRGQSYEIAITAASSASTQTLPFYTTVFIDSPVVLERGDVCNNFVGDYRCPIQQDETFVFSTRFTMPTDIPATNTTITINGRDNGGVIRVCVNVPASVL